MWPSFVRYQPNSLEMMKTTERLVCMLFLALVLSVNYSRSANIPEVHINTYNFIFFADISKSERTEVAC